MTHPEFDDVDEGAAVLLLASAGSDADEHTCIDLLTPADPERSDVISVSFTKSVDELAAVWERHADGPPSSAAIITLDMLDSRDATAPDTTCAGPDDLDVETVRNPSALTQLGVHITEYLSRWTDTDAQTVLCIQSLTVLLQYVDVGQVCQFIHVLSGKIAVHDAVAHFHVDPDAHDEETVRTLMQFCDGIVDRCESGY